MSQPPSRRRLDRSRNPNSRHSQTLPPLLHCTDGSSDSVSLPDLNLTPQLDFCPDIDLFSDIVDPNFHHHGCSLDLDFGSTGHLSISNFTDSEEEDVESAWEREFQFQCELEPHNLLPERLRVSPIDSDSDMDGFVHGVDCWSCDTESEGSYLGLGPVDFGLRLGGTDQGSITDPEVESEEIISEVDEVRSMSTGMDSHLSEFEFSSGFPNFDDLLAPDDSYMAFLGMIEVQDDGEIDLEQLVENVGVLRGFHPAAKSVVDQLPVVEMGMENVGACPICIDEISGGEKVTMLPCKHYYHGDCILPWLMERNTCPVCRYELPAAEEDEESFWLPQPAAAIGDSLYW